MCWVPVGHCPPWIMASGSTNGLPSIIMVLQCQQQRFLCLPCKQAEWWPCRGLASPAVLGGIPEFLGTLGKGVKAASLPFWKHSPPVLGVGETPFMISPPGGQSLRSFILCFVTWALLPIKLPIFLWRFGTVMRQLCWEWFANAEWAEGLKED